MEFDLPLYKLQSESELSDLAESVDSAQMELTGTIRTFILSKILCEMLSIICD